MVKWNFSLLFFFAVLTGVFSAGALSGWVRVSDSPCQWTATVLLFDDCEDGGNGEKIRDQIFEIFYSCNDTLLRSLQNNCLDPYQHILCSIALHSPVPARAPPMIA